MPEITAPLRDTTPDSHTDGEGLFPIREVARLTGVNPVTLRAWERRYGLIQPLRTESGHRLYSSTDIETVHRILDWIERGVAVSKVGKLLARDPQSSELATASRSDTELEWRQWQAQLRQAISAFDDRELDRLYGQIFSVYSTTVVFQDILVPLWQQLSRHQGRLAKPASGCSSIISCARVSHGACKWPVPRQRPGYCCQPLPESAVSWSCWWRAC